MKNAVDFLKKQKLMVIASCDRAGPWVANVYFAADEKGTIYFISPKDAKHSAMVINNPNVAFSVAWFDQNNQRNRKGIQGLGICRTASNPIEIARGIKLLYEKFPDLRDILTVKWIMENARGSKVWTITPTCVKYWDDELYGEDESKEFFFAQT